MRWDRCRYRSGGKKEEKKIVFRKEEFERCRVTISGFIVRTIRTGIGIVWIDFFEDRTIELDSIVN